MKVQGSRWIIAWSKGLELLPQFIETLLVLWPFVAVLIAMLWWLRFRKRELATKVRSSGGV
jgi:hypothetical protein